MISKPKISLGFPLYNEEKFLRERLESILTQTFDDFELIISDNASTDSTEHICKEYATKDKRIKYIRQPKNMGSSWNFIFVLQESIGKYFMWVAADDKITNNYLEKNVNVLDHNSNVVASIGKQQRYDDSGSINLFQINSTDSFIKKIYKKIRNHFRPFGSNLIIGNLENRVQTYLRYSSLYNVYALCRTNELKQSMKDASYFYLDFTIILNLLKYGEFNVVEDTTFFVYLQGSSSRSIIEIYRSGDINFFDLFFRYRSFPLWFAKQFGTKLMLQNLDYFIWLNMKSPIAFIIAITILFKNAFKK